MMPGAPLLNVSGIRAAFFGPDDPKVSWFGTDPDLAICFYSHARLALVKGISAIMKFSKQDRAVVYVPDYFCEESLSLLRKLPVRIAFYPILKNLSPDWRALKEADAETRGLKLLLLVHYFGFPNDIEEAVDFCKENNMVLIEDGAHMLKPQRETGKGHMMIFSPRKLLPIPWGAVLVIQKEFGQFVSDGSQSIVTGSILPWFCLKLLQLCLVELGIPWRSLRRHQASKRNVAGSPDQNSGMCGKPVLGMIADADLLEILEIRRNNFNRIASHIEGLSRGRILFPLGADDTCPYVFPLIVDENMEALLESFREMGIPAMQWPPLPPEVLSGGERHRNALWAKEHLLLLPLHQSLTCEHADTIGRTIRCGLA